MASDLTDGPDPLNGRQQVFNTPLILPVEGIVASTAENSKSSTIASQIFCPRRPRIMRRFRSLHDGSRVRALEGLLRGGYCDLKEAGGRGGILERMRSPLGRWRMHGCNYVLYAVLEEVDLH
jgi:hypothetical protein